jgi:carboxypeptidase C (cathepsin A)
LIERKLTLSESYPPYYMLGYLAQQSVQKSLGVRVNYTEFSESVNQALGQTGDRYRSGSLEDLGFLLDRGVKVAMVYGDRNAECNWMGGEAVSLAVPWQGNEEFNKSGYTEFKTDTGAVRGFTRQHGGLSFTRIFQAGECLVVLLCSF